MLFGRESKMRSHKLFCADYPNLIAALILCFHFVNGAIGIQGISAINIAFILGLEVIYIFRKGLKINKYAVLLILSILIVFLFSFLRLSDTHNTLSYFAYFIAFGIVSLLSGTETVNPEKVVKTVLYIGFIGICVYLFRGFESYNSSDTMGISYAMLPVFFSSIIAIAYYKHIRFLALVCAILSLYIYFLYSPRGVWVTILFFGFFFVLFKIVHYKNNYTQSRIKIIFLILIIIGSWVFIANLYEIINWLDQFVENVFHVSISALNKILFYYKKGDLLNGRIEIWGLAWSYIEQSPFFGNGIGYFENMYRDAHPHNILLQAMCEQGIIVGGAAVAWLLVNSLRSLLRTSSSITCENYCYSLMVITLGLVPLFYSSSYWLWVPFWYFVGYLISNYMKGSVGAQKEVK